MIADWLACYRAVRLLQRDEVWPLPELRAKLVANDRFMTSRWSQLLDCPWCLSIHVGVGLWVLRMVCPRLHQFLVMILASSAVAGVITEGLDALDALTQRIVE